MPAIRREERILNLLSALLAARGPLPFDEIRGRVSGYDDDATPDALDKRFDRDKATLRKAGVPLEYVAENQFGESGYRIAKDRFFLSQIRFSVEEGIVLAALQRAAASRPGRAVRDSLRSALMKIGVDSPLTDAFRESVAEQQLLDPRISREESEPLAALAEALVERRPVEFSYYTLGSGETAVRRVECYGIGYFRGRWYLVGLDVAKGAERVFRTSRIRGAVTVFDPTGYRIPKKFNLRSRLGLAPWELREGPRVTARIRLSEDVAWMLAENLRPGQKFEEVPGGGVLTVKATDPDALVRWVAQYGPSAEILGPAHLRARMCGHLRELVRRSGS